MSLSDSECGLLYVKLYAGSATGCGVCQYLKLESDKKKNSWELERWLYNYLLERLYLNK